MSSNRQHLSTMASAEEEFLSSKSTSKEIQGSTICSTKMNLSGKNTVTKILSKTTNSLERSVSSSSTTSVTTSSMDSNMMMMIGNDDVIGGLVEEKGELLKSTKTKTKKLKEKKISEKSMKSESITSHQEMIDETIIGEKQTMEGQTAGVIKKKSRKNSQKSLSLDTSVAITMDDNVVQSSKKSIIEQTTKKASQKSLLQSTTMNAITSSSSNEVITGEIRSSDEVKTINSNNSSISSIKEIDGQKPPKQTEHKKKSSNSKNLTMVSVQV